MDAIGIIKDKFSFLIEKKFKCKIKQKNSETQIVFAKNDCQFELFIVNYSESLDVVVSKGKQRLNIINFPFSEKSKNHAVQQALKMPGLINKINAISLFISVNLIELM